LAEKEAKQKKSSKELLAENTQTTQSKSNIFCFAMRVGGGGVAGASQKYWKKEFTWRDNVKLICLARG